jgi:glycosyltransferase involved in cell wall biosynthesis
VHDHSLAGPLAAGSREAATIVTAHGPVEGEMGYYYGHLDPRVRLVAISDAQRDNAPDLPWVGHVYNAVPVDEYPFSDIKEDVAVFLGRMHPTKAPHIAIRAARAAGLPLILAGKCTEPLELDYFENEVKPLLGPDVEWVGELETEPKKQCLQRARCLVFPIQWNEPFGIVMAEAMACGTPVVALKGGSVSEVVLDGVTGFVCRNESELPDRIKMIDKIDPVGCRKHVQETFNIEKMVSGYESIYLDVVNL